MKNIILRHWMILLISLIVIIGATGDIFAMDREERILSFHSDIIIHQDATMTVMETIRVRSEGIDIKRGIYRDFPTRYRDHSGNRIVVDFELLEAKRDDKPETYRLENNSNGVRIYLGNSDVYLSPGDYTYTLRYKTNRQLGFFDDHDELYWNVTGNGWKFKIDNASAIVTLPPGVDSHEVGVYGYTGPKGSTETNYSSNYFSPDILYYQTTQPLGLNEGFTLVATWPKGFVQEPTQQEKLAYLFQDNKSLLLGIAALLILFAFYFVVWSLVGKDPPAGTIIPLYEPPDGFSPAAIRFISRMRFDHKTFAAALISMAVKGYLIIEQTEHKFALKKGSADKEVLSPDEYAIALQLKLWTRKKLDLKNTNHLVIGNAIKALRKKLQANYEKEYFFTNLGYFITGLSLSLAAVLIIGIVEAMAGNPVMIFMMIWLSIWSIGVAFLTKSAIQAWREAKTGADVFSALFLTLFAMPFWLGEIVAIIVLMTQTSFLLVLTLIAIGVMNFVFYQLLKAPTLKGRRVLDRVEGFRLYLSVAEKDRLNMLNPPEKTPELFEAFLPYALALDVEQEWAEQFSSILSQIQSGEMGYSPRWYSGSSWNRLATGGFVTGLSSLTGAISSSSTAPGSSSGSSGGSSGGGGGGGGGGGW